MFMGSIPGAMRQYVAECVRSWGTDTLYVGCSGNFTIERCLPGMKHHGNDVTLYSSVIGWWAAGDKEHLHEVRLNEHALDVLPWLADSFTTPDEKVAVTMLGTRFLNSVDRDNVFHKRNVQAYRDQWGTVFGKTLAKVKASTLRLDSYYAGDVREWLDQHVPQQGAVAMFPPFFAGDYESMFAPLEKFIDWPEPAYPELDEAGKDAMVEQIIDRPQWMIGLHQERPDLRDHLKGMVQTTNRGVPIYLYASHGSPRRVVAPKQPLETVLVSRLDPADTLTGTERIALAPLTGAQFSTLRSQYMNRTIKPGSPLMALAVLIDEKIAGCIAFNPPDSKFDPHSAYLLSDFAVVPTKYKRLAALIVQCAQSVEAQRLLERSLSRRVNWIETTAFSNNQSSMKYRSGKMKRLTCKEGTDGHHRFMLQYGAEAGRWSLAEALADWVKQHGQVLEGDASGGSSR